jgi:hypothetical protein
MNIIWNITKLTCLPGEYEGRTNVIANIEWKATATKTENGTTYTTEQTGVIGSGFNPDLTEFTPYEQLTEEQIVQWVWANGVSKLLVETMLGHALDEQIAGINTTPNLPW